MSQPPPQGGHPPSRKPKSNKLSWEFVDDGDLSTYGDGKSSGLGLSNVRAGIAVLLIIIFTLMLVTGTEMRKLLGSPKFEPQTWFKSKPYWQTTEELQERLTSDGQPFVEPRFRGHDQADDDTFDDPAIDNLDDAYSKRRRRRSLLQEEEGGKTSEYVGGAGELSSWPSWPPPHCKGVNPVGKPKIRGQRRRLRSLLQTFVNNNSNNNTESRRNLLSEAPTKLLVDSNPPDTKLQTDVYDFLRDVMASPTMCRPRSLGTASKLPCRGMGGGMSCRGATLPLCEAAGSPPVGPKGFSKPVQWRKPPLVFGTDDDSIMQPGALGSCAFIATGETVLRGSFGDDINKHDTVIRYNTPIKGFEKHVGTKTTLMWTKSKYGTTANPTMGYIDSGGAGAKGRLARGQKRYRSSNTEVRAFRDLLHRIWFQARGIKEGKAAAGFTRALMLVKSGLCSQVSLYGFQTQSKGRAGKYFAKKAVVTPGHAIDWDGWLLKALMDLGFLCVYGP